MNRRIRVYGFRVFFLLLLIGGSFFVSNVRAADIINDSNITIQLDPSAPGPFQETTITLVSYLADLNQAKITWQQDGKKVLSNIGAKSFSFTTKDVGSTTSITVFIDILGSPLITKQLSVTPNNIDLLWEATDSYVPPFYEGKALPTSQSKVRVVAIPNTNIGSGGISPGNFVYQWKLNFDPDQDQSGYSKNAFIYANSFLNKSDTISVTASSTSGGGSADASIDIPINNPLILFYENNPLLGLDFSKALNNGFDVTGRDARIVAEPFFFSPKDPTSNELTYTWTMNNNPINTPSTPNQIAFSRTADQTGQSRISLSIDSVTKLYLSAQSFFLINLK